MAAELTVTLSAEVGVYETRAIHSMSAQHAQTRGAAPHFDSQTESDLLLRSLSRSLYPDGDTPAGRRINGL